MFRKAYLLAIGLAFAAIVPSDAQGGALINAP